MRRLNPVRRRQRRTLDPHHPTLSTHQLRPFSLARLRRDRPPLPLHLGAALLCDLLHRRRHPPPLHSSLFTGADHLPPLRHLHRRLLLPPPSRLIGAVLPHHRRLLRSSLPTGAVPLHHSPRLQPPPGRLDLRRLLPLQLLLRGQELLLLHQHQHQLLLLLLLLPEVLLLLLLLLVPVVLLVRAAPLFCPALCPDRETPVSHMRT